MIDDEIMRKAMDENSDNCVDERAEESIKVMAMHALTAAVFTLLIIVFV